jgi:hypothetical protein
VSDVSKPHSVWQVRDCVYMLQDTACCEGAGVQLGGASQCLIMVHHCLRSRAHLSFSQVCVQAHPGVLASQRCHLLHKLQAG